jgi:tetratricopeptide (TPR) repeat protein
MLLGNIYATQLADYDQAIVEFQRVATGKGFSNVERAEAKLETGNAYYRQGNFEQAKIEYQGIPELTPDTALAHRSTLQLAQTYDADGDFEKAIHLYRKIGAVEEKGSEEELRQIREIKQLARFGEASALEELEHYVQALQIFNEILDSYPSRKVVEIRITRLTQRMREVGK